ncbi:hypothetical protein P8452_09322 [Trifolium repens]|nr:hypothetical protein P8452_09322 [Trifolium repens]
MVETLVLVSLSPKSAVLTSHISQIDKLEVYFVIVDLRIERHGVSWLTFSKWRKLFFSTLKVLSKLKLLQMEQGDETMARMTSSRQGSVQQHRSCNRWRYSIDGDVVMGNALAVSDLLLRVHMRWRKQ